MLQRGIVGQSANCLRQEIDCTYRSLKLFALDIVDVVNQDPHALLFPSDFIRIGVVAVRSWHILQSLLDVILKILLLFSFLYDIFIGLGVSLIIREEVLIMACEGS